MILNEKVACTKACCRMVAVPNTVLGSSQRMLQTCVGSMCMAWRPYPATQWDAELKQDIPMGFCGLSGPPTHVPNDIKAMGENEEIRTQ